MSSVKLKLVLKLILFFPFLMVSFYAFYVLKAYRLQQKRKALSSQAGRQFPSIPLKDVHGNAVSLDISGTRLTVIDFWYRNCVPCIVEMNQFEKHLKGKEQEIAVISISVDDAAAWKAAAGGDDPRFAFMSRPVANWHHLLLDYGTDSTGNNINTKQLAARLNVTGYPAFFVLDKTGIIKATPASAVAYIQSAGKKEHPFLQFLILPATWQRYYWVLVLSLLAYGAILMALNKLLPKNNRV